MEVKSHVQMPKGLMKAFSHPTKDGKCVYYLDLKDMEIKEAKINELGTIRGLYDPKSEEMLDHLYESPFFQVTQDIKKFYRGKSEVFSLTQENVKALKDFLTISLMRSDATRELAASKSILASIFPESLYKYFVPAMQMALPNIPLLDGLHINFLLNGSKLPLVAPRNCVVFSFIKSLGSYILPINPYCAILFQAEELYLSTFNKDGEVCYAFVKEGEEKTIRLINFAAGKSERATNNEFLIGKNREELEILKRDLSGEQK